VHSRGARRSEGRLQLLGGSGNGIRFVEALGVALAGELRGDYQEIVCASCTSANSVGRTVAA